MWGEARVGRSLKYGGRFQTVANIGVVQANWFAQATATQTNKRYTLYVLMCMPRAWAAQDRQGQYRVRNNAPAVR